ncbi:MAG TPA: hypothetical protein PLV04_05315 [Phenylobacterium sp.]|nr:hypothetical protein [Phenylobacterium sp.]
MTVSWVIPSIVVCCSILSVLILALLSALSGWFELQKLYPDRDDEVLARFRFRSGSLGKALPVHMNGMLHLTACRSGLRVGMWRLFGPFSRNFLVPWQDIAVSRSRRLIWRRAVISLGAESKLEISGHLADRIALAAGSDWPERPLPLRERPVEALRGVVVNWLLVSSLYGLLFSAMRRPSLPTAGGSAALDPFLTSFALIGIVSVFAYFRRISSGRP